MGLILESNMSWNLHINHISLKISKAIGILYRLKTIYPQLVLQSLYNTLILPYFNYCILVWGATINEGNPHHLLQKKALRLISNSNYIAHTVPICKKLHLLKLTDMFSIAVWKFYYKLMNNQLPTCKTGRGYFPYFLLLQLRNSSYGCHLNGVYMGALSYADDITLIAPSILEV